MSDRATEPIRLARALAEGRGLCFLDDPTGCGPSRLFADPAAVFTSRDCRGALVWQGGRAEAADGDPFERLASILEEHTELVAAGYWSYDLRYCVERLPHLAFDDLGLPDCRVALYPRGSIRDFEPSPAGGCLPAAALAHAPPVPARAEVASDFTRAEYQAAVRRVLEYIAAGDCYQVNLAQRFEAPLRCPPWQLYERLRAASPAPFAGFLDCVDHQVLSSSPELFLRVRDHEVETRPIKGTRPRGRMVAEDRARAEELLRSAKDRAELLMIVDLERNDLGRVSEFGSVHVHELYRLESYRNVHHLVASVRGRLRPGVGAMECLRAAFPGGSITGAPKIRAMEIIEELEPIRRGVYTGAIGWVDGAGNAEWSIAIRTMLVRGGRVYFHAGGGIVADSDPAAEYDETLAKAAGMLAALADQTA